MPVGGRTAACGRRAQGRAPTGALLQPLLPCLLLSLRGNHAIGQELFEVFGQRRREVQLVTTVVCKGDGLRVQKQALETELFGLLIRFLIAVSEIPCDWMPSVLQVDADLVSTPGRWRTLSGSHVASSGKKIRTNTMTTMIRNIGIAARAIKFIS